MVGFNKKSVVLFILLCVFVSVAAQQKTAGNTFIHGYSQIAAKHPLSTKYAVIDLGGLAGSKSAQALAVNDLGQIVGKSANHAFLWENGVMTDLGTLGGHVSSANAINDLGQVVGESETATGEVHAFIWEQGSMRDLGSAGETSSAHGINKGGVIIGAMFAKNIRGGAVVWKDGVRQYLGDLGLSGSGSTAMAINNGGEIAGVSSGFAASGGVVRAVIWENGAIRDIGTLGGLHSSANALNTQGEVVGWAEIGDQVTAGFFWRNGAMQQLGMLSNGSVAPGNGTQAAAINDYSQIVGSSLNSKGESRAVIWENTKITDLNDLIHVAKGLVLTQATAINNQGQIVVEQQTPDQPPKSFLLVP
jgi:probable HAF family extracellular repeat protein